MKTALLGAGFRLVEFLALVVLPLTLFTLIVVGRFAVTTVLPAVVLVLLAVVSGAARTAGLVLFGAVVVLRRVWAGADRLGEIAPAPRLRLGVSGR
ncbi:hypothetical protein F1721_06915 [Saccharopolyspora hirsuta]|uniref:Uncharacterized protein n=1 Tax=Saccharopolyspora hirsuta TaxID=1837 RepID=A0A5M7C8S8_SACHI|nr:hypothetical protein [Saccharopolyspora hirsuta]KAA5836064.1 hypothetical protein F1721_06915 [Saccharopolyspora hirsuta]